MKWASERHVVTREGGTCIQFNLTPDAWLVADASTETLERAAATTLAGVSSHYDISSWRRAVRDVPRSGNVAEAEQWIDDCCVASPKQSRRGAHWLALLSNLRLEGALLWPAVQAFLPYPGHPHYPADTKLFARGALTDYERFLISRTGNEPSRVMRCMMLSASPLLGPDDIDEAAWLSILDRSAFWWRSMQSGDADLSDYKRGLTFYTEQASFLFMGLFRAMEALPRKRSGPVVMAGQAETILRAYAVRGKKPERWGAHEANPLARCWIDAFERYSSSQANKRLASAEDGLLRFLDYLGEAGPILPIEAVNRNTHIVGPAGFLEWLERRFDTNSAMPGKLAAQLRRFYAWQSSQDGRPNPVAEHDILRRQAKNNKSSNLKTPRDVIQVAREVVRELIEFAHGQVDGNAGTSFGNTLSDTDNPADGTETAKIDNGDWTVDPATAPFLPATLRRPCNFKKHLVRVNNSDGSWRTLLSPVMPTLLLLLLTVPIRGLHGRLLDSGEADELKCNLTTEAELQGDGSLTHRVNFEWLPNDHSLARRSRRQGVIRGYDDRGSRGSLGLYINTNKPHAADEIGHSRGFEIPWQHPEILDRLHRLLKWQQRFNPADRFLTLKDVGKLESALMPSPGLGKLAEHIFLFRQYDHNNLAFRQHPPTENDCSSFFKCVLDEVEARLQEQVVANNKAEPDPKKHRELPILVLSRDGRRPMNCVYTLHGLRITGITAFAEAGVPAPIIAEFLSGHLSVLMAIYYMKFGPATMTRVLAEAERLIESGALHDATREGSQSQADLLVRMFVSESESAIPGAREQLPGFWKWFIDGICPNGMTRCEDGGPQIEKKERGMFAAVEGGARNCPMCRFWLTGPRFVAGQIIMANASLHKSRSLALALQGLWAQRSDPANKRKMGWINDRIDKTEAELNTVLRTLNARVRLLEKSLALARQPDSDVAAPSEDGETPESLDLITRMRDSDVHVTARSTSQLGYLDFMTRAVRLFPEIEAHDAPIELGMMIDRLLDENGYRGMLYKLPDDMRAKAGIAFMDCIRSEAPADVQEDEFVDQVARGERRIFQFDRSRIEAEMTRAAGRAIRLEPLLSGEDPSTLPTGLTHETEYA